MQRNVLGGMETVQGEPLLSANVTSAYMQMGGGRPLEMVASVWKLFGIMKASFFL